jgi:hypothetical protein
MEKQNVFNTLNAVDVNGHTEKKSNLTYLSWVWAWGETVKRYPEAAYEVMKDPNGLPYFSSPLGIMVYTRVTIEGQTREMWLPVMDGANRALTAEPRVIKSKYGDTAVPAATMFDVNKAIMRCLTKNLAMFGLGLYIYAGEDLPEAVKEEQAAAAKEEWLAKVETCDESGLAALYNRRAEWGDDKEIKEVMLARLRYLIKQAASINDTRRIYAASKWTQKDPRLLEWCKERNDELAADLADAALQGGTTD